MKKPELPQGQVDLSNEPFQVVLRLPETPFLTRITYSKKNKGRVIEIEELSIDGKETLLHSCTFKGKATQGDGCSWLKDLRSLANNMKVSDWKQNDTIYKDGYYKNH